MQSDLPAFSSVQGVLQRGEWSYYNTVVCVRLGHAQQCPEVPSE